jgi:hypothetical protein
MIILLFLIVAIIVAKKDDTYALYDLKDDPDEITDYYHDETYASSIDKLEQLTNVWSNESITIDPQIPDNSTALGMSYVCYSFAQDTRFTFIYVGIWEENGGVCSWIDIDYDITNVDQIYFANNPPNIVFIMIDDWGWNDYGLQSTHMSWTTPNLDRLGEEGIRFKNYFTHSTCIPSRGAFLTGRYPMRLGLWDEDDQVNHPELPLEEVTLAQELKSAGNLCLNEYVSPLKMLSYQGYRTYMIGKWNLGYSTKFHTPLCRGFDTFYGFYNGKNF